MSDWDSRHPDNIPGPVYVTTWDTGVGTSEAEAPRIFACVLNSYEYVYRQPETPEDWASVEIAIDCDMHDAIFIDGDSFWTPEEVLTWLATVQRKPYYHQPGDLPVVEAYLKRYVDYLVKRGGTA